MYNSLSKRKKHSQATLTLSVTKNSFGSSLKSSECYDVVTMQGIAPRCKRQMERKNKKLFFSGKQPETNYVNN
jgi:hypothetical protein